MNHEYNTDFMIRQASGTTLMLPTAVPTSAQMQLDDVLDSFNVIQKVQWFAAARSATPAMSRISRCCLPDGSDLPSILENRKDITELASIWLSDSKTLGETVHINKDSEGKSRFELRRTGNESLPQHLAGEGVRWLLPILLAACWAEIGGEGAPTILAVEEPEARLHPNLQIVLLNRLLSMINAKGIPCVLETHSIYLLRRAQLAVAQKELSPSDLAIYWIERTDHAAQVRKIEIDSDGTLRGWNPETFEEEQHLSREIFEARWKSSTT